METHRFGTTTIHWDPVRGRGLRTNGPLTPGHRAAVARWGDVDALSGVWVRHRAAITVPGGIWAPVAAEAGSGGHAYRLIPLTPDELAVLDAVNDRRRGTDLLERVAVPSRTIRALAARLTAFDVGALQLWPTPPARIGPGLRRVLGAHRPANDRTADQYDSAGRTSLTAYHEDAIVDGATHFDDRETTVAHAFGVAHPAFDGQRYGERLRAVLGARGWPVDGPVLECGCGTGELAAAWGPPTSGRYLRIDLSPELLRVQAAAAPWSQGRQADLTALPLDDASVPLLICNEVLADLAAVPVDADDPTTAALRERYGIAPVPAGFYNPGAWRAIQEAARVLAPGGRALFTEFGVVEGPAEEATQLDHPEVGIHFGHLVRIGRELGLEVHLERLDDLLQPRADATWLARHSWRALRSWARSKDVRLSARAWTPDTLATALPGAVGGLEWVGVLDDGPGPLMTRFFALSLRKP
jgi:SAM-dependent methyltransferase